MSDASLTVTMRGLPDANTNPSASAPSATERSASSSVVMPQILMNIRLPSLRPVVSPSIGSAPDAAVGGRSRATDHGATTVVLRVDQATVEEVVVRRQVEEAVTAEVEED